MTFNHIFVFITIISFFDELNEIHRDPEIEGEEVENKEAGRSDSALQVLSVSSLQSRMTKQGKHITA